MKRWILLLLMLSRVSTAVDLDRLEVEWEQGDEVEELRPEGQEQYELLSRKSPEEAKTLGPQMFFVTLKGDRSPDELEGIAANWKRMLSNGGVHANVFDLKQSRLLVGIQKGIFASDVRKFLHTQRDIDMYEWNGHVYEI